MQTYSTQTSDGPSAAGDSSATEQAKDKAQQAAGQAQAKAQEAAGQAKGALRTQVDQRSTEAGDRVGGFASDVRSVSEQLREQGKDQPAKLAEQAADRAERRRPLPEGERRGSHPLRRRGLRPAPAVGRDRRRRRARFGRVALPEGLEHAALRPAVGESRSPARPDL